MTDHSECHETVDPATREAILDKYGHRCQGCGRRGPEAGGLATLHVHHLERNPKEMDEHDHENLTVQCRACHSWLHQQSTPDDAPVELSEGDLTVLLPQDIEILRLLADDGPARTGNVASELTADLSVTAIRERLWVLMGLDNIVDSREKQVVDKDVETGEWGLAGQIANSARGRIPDDPQLLLQRMEDEQVRQALDRGCDRGTITEVLGVSRRTTFYKQKRAHAYDFPLDAFGRGGQPGTNDEQETQSSAADNTFDSESKEQQRLDTVNSEKNGTGGAEAKEHSEPSAENESRKSNSCDNQTEEQLDTATDADVIRAHLQEVIDTLHESDTAM